jgi:hypothetical protein
MLTPTLLAGLLYAGIFFTYRMLHPAGSYEGTRAGTHLIDALNYIVRYGASSLPGFELLINRDPAHPALAGYTEIAHRLSTLNVLRIPWAIAIGAASAWMLARTGQWALCWRDTLLLSLAIAALGLLFLTPPAVSAKYQVYAHRRLYPHAYNFIMVHFLWLAVTVAGLGAMAALPARSIARRGAAGMLGLAFGLICLTAQITNPLALQQIKATVSAPN